MHAIAGADNKLAVGDGHGAVPLHGGVKHAGDAVELAGQILQGQAHHHVVLLGAELHHLHPALGKGLDVAGEGKAQQPADFQGRGALGVDGHVDAQLLLKEHQAVVVLGVADAGDGVLRAKALGDQAAEHVGLVAGGGGDDDVRPVDAGVNESLGVGAVAADAEHVQLVLTALENLLVGVENHDVVLLLGQMLRQRMADLAVAYHKDSHGRTSPNERNHTQTHPL